ncbi:MAG: 50S ribosomal protein L19, partial [Candidatus Spechtbacteria bacterium]|nr:50S ribosomal protein L19 [Candidatus Spechtbacteria bacterium]
MDKVLEFTKKYTKRNIPPLQTGDTVRVYERLKEGDKDRVQAFEGVVIARKHGTKGLNATFTVRKISYGVGVEKTFPLHSPNIEKIEVVKHDKVRRAKLYYVRDLTRKKNKRRASKML